MSLDRLTPLDFGLGLGLLALTLLGLHLLRVRVRRVDVDSLLFFAAAAEPVRRRSLLGIPSRWWSFLLGLLLVGSLWSVFGGLKDAPGDGPSRVVIVDRSGRLAELPAPDMPLGPRGRIQEVGTMWTGTRRDAGEPDLLVSARRQLLPGPTASGGDGGLPAALSWAGMQAGVDGEIVVIGGPEALPSRVGGHPVRRIPGPEANGPRLVDIRLPRVPGMPLQAAVAGPLADGATLSLAGASARLTGTGNGLLRGTLPVPAAGLTGTLRILDRAGVTVLEQPVEIPPRQVVPARWDADLPPPLRLALASDPALRKAGEEEAGELLFARTEIDAANGSGTMPTCWLHGPGGGSPAPDQIPIQVAMDLPDWLMGVAPPSQCGVLTAIDAPLIEVWWSDQGGNALLGRDAQGHIHTAAGLFQHAADGAVPQLALTIARHLAGMHTLAIGPAGSASGSDALTTVPVQPPGGAPSKPAGVTGNEGNPPVETAAEPGWLPPALLLLALLLLLTDLWFHHRGRLP